MRGWLGGFQKRVHADYSHRKRGLQPCRKQGFGWLLPAFEVKRLPAQRLHDRALGFKKIEDPGLSDFPHFSDYGSDFGDVIRLPGLEKPSANQVVNFTLFFWQTERALTVRMMDRRNDRMVICDLGVV